MTNRIVLFSDIQGNNVALDAMFDWLKTQADFDSLAYICLGDTACGYAPNAVLDTLRQYDVTCITGNMDDVILKPERYTGNDAAEKQFNAMDFWASETLTPVNRDFLSNTITHLKRDFFTQHYLFAHGNAIDYNIALNYDMPQNALATHIPDDIDVMFTGHTHQQFMIPVGDSVLINPGSVGFPDASSNGKRPLSAQFIIMDEGRFEFVTVHYEHEEFTVAVTNSTMPHAAWYLNQWDI